MQHIRTPNIRPTLLGISYRSVYVSTFLFSAVGIFVSAGLRRSILPPLLVMGVTIFACLCLVSIQRGQKLSSLPLGPDVLVLGLLGPGVFLSGIYLACYEAPNLIGLVAHSHTQVLWYAFKALLLCFIGLMGFSLGYYAWPKSSARPCELGEEPKANRTALFIALGMAALGILIALQYIRVRGGIVNFMQVWNDRDELFQVPIYDRIVAILPMATVIIFCAPIRRWYYWAMVTPIASFTLFSMYATGGRHNVLRFSFACFIALLFTPRFVRFIRKNPISVCVTGIVFFLIVYVSVGILRGTAGTRMLGAGDFFSDAFFILGQSQILDSLLSAYYLPSLVPICLSVYTFPGVFGFVGGDSLLAAIDVYVPKFIWSDFPNYQMGKALRSSIYGDDADSGLYASYIGEMWANFGYLGPFIGMLALGGVARFSMSLLSRDPVDPMKRAFYAITFGSVVPMFLVVNAKPAAFNTVFLYIFLILAWGAYLVAGGNIQRRN